MSSIAGSAVQSPLTSGPRAACSPWNSGSMPHSPSAEAGRGGATEVKTARARLTPSGNIRLAHTTPAVFRQLIESSEERLHAVTPHSYLHVRAIQGAEKLAIDGGV